MNAKQKRFCDEYLVDLNATQAAIRAGYKEKTAYSMGQRLLKNVEIKHYIDSVIEELHSQRTADAQEVIEYLTAVMRGEHKDQTLRFVGDGVQQLINIAVPARDRLKAAELLGKRYGLFSGPSDAGGAAAENNLLDILKEGAAGEMESAE